MLIAIDPSVMYLLILGAIVAIFLTLLLGASDGGQQVAALEPTERHVHFHLHLHAAPPQPTLPEPENRMIVEVPTRSTAVVLRSPQPMSAFNRDPDDWIQLPVRK